MRIRAATPTDVPSVLLMVDQICELHKSWDSAKYGFLPNPAQHYRQWLVRQASSDRSVFLVADAETDQNLLVGFLVATIEEEVPIYQLTEYGFIHDLWVEPEYRKAGVGRQLVEQAMQQFAQKQIKQVRLDTAAINEAARRLFQSCGFRLSTIELLAELDPE